MRGFVSVLAKPHYRPSWHREIRATNGPSEASGTRILLDGAVV